jgi:hypothetical protein
VISRNAKTIVVHENDMLLHVIVMISVEVQVRNENKMTETIKARTTRASNKTKVAHPSMRHVSNPELNDTAVVFTNASHILWIV